MKKVFSRLVSISLVALLTIVSINTVMADGNVTYDGDAQEFIFAPGSEYSPTDLFTDFKDLMPGDSVSQLVTIDNNISKNVKIKIYMRSLGANEGSEEFLSQLNLKVDTEDDTNLFDAPADQTAGLTDWVYLGTLYSGGKIDLKVTVDVPITLGNDFQDSVGYLTWQFKVEELPVEPDDPKPSTGDHSNIIIVSAIAGCSLAAIGVVLYIKKKHDKEA